jgi:hypothetical protein
MLDHVFASPDTLRVVLVLVPAIMFVWIIMTVMALHKREVYFWSLGSTWSTILACPIALLIITMSGWSQLHDPNAALFQSPIVAGAILYAVALAFAVFYNYNATKSVALAISTSVLQQLAVLGVIFLFIRWSGYEANRGR